MSIGSIVEDAMNGDTVRDYSFAGTPGGVYAVFLEVLQGDVMLLVVDSANGRVAGTTYASAGTGTLYDRATADFQDPAGGPFLISVRASPVGSAARFRFLAFAVDVAPEAAKARFTIGDTVMGEAIDPMVDVDDFTAHVIGCCSTR